MLRVLVVVGVDTNDKEQDTVAAGEEVERVKEELARYAGFVDLELRDRPSSGELRDCYNSHRPHILHFIGHGVAGPAGGILRIRPKDGQAGWSWNATKIATDLQRWTPRLVILNACRSVEVSDQKGVWELIDAFVEMGAPAVVGMQGDVKGPAASAFARELYRALADDEPVDVAVARARNGVADATDVDSHEPWLPCLIQTAVGESVFPRRYALKPADSQAIVRRQTFEKIRAFVDRKEQRRTLWDALNGGNGSPGAVAVQGPEQSGKSALVKWCIGSLVLRGRNAAYLDLSLWNHLDSVEFLGAVAEELSQLPSRREANHAAFDGWLREVDRLMGRNPPGPTEPVGNGRYARRLEEGSETIGIDVIPPFAAALERVAGGESVVLALEGLQQIESGSWDRYLFPHLVTPILERKLPVQLVLVTKVKAHAELITPNLLEKVEEVTVGALPAGEAPALLTEYLLAEGYDKAYFGDYIKSLGGQPSAWGTKLFPATDNYAAAFDWPKR
jgi:hypothetical protein